MAEHRLHSPEDARTGLGDTLGGKRNAAPSTRTPTGTRKRFDSRRARRFKPDSRPGITWGQWLGEPECYYLRRWVLNFGFFAIRLHRWYGSDDHRAFHDHGWWFATLVLRGGYTDCSPAGRDHLGRGSFRLRPATHQHTVEVDEGGALTLMLSGPVRRKWGFWVDGEFVGVRAYFRKFGHPACD